LIHVKNADALLFYSVEQNMLSRCNPLSRCYCFEVIQTITMQFPGSTISSFKNVLKPVFKRRYDSQIQAALAYRGKQLGFGVLLLS